MRIKGINYTELELIESLIAKRIHEHELEHWLLYTEDEKEILRPIWRKNIIDEMTDRIPCAVLEGLRKAKEEEK